MRIFVTLSLLDAHFLLTQYKLYNKLNYFCFMSQIYYVVTLNGMSFAAYKSQQGAAACISNMRRSIKYCSEDVIQMYRVICN